MAELTERQWRVVVDNRKAMHETIARSYPGDVGPLLAVAVAGGFADLCATSSEPGVRDLVAVINAQLRGVGLQLAPLRRH